MKTTTVNRFMSAAGFGLLAAAVAYGIHLWLGVGVDLSQILLAAAALVAVIPIAYRAWQAVRFRAFSIELLVTVAVVGALIIGEVVEAAVVSFLFLFGAFLEARSLARTRSYLEGLIDLSPTTAVVARIDDRGEPQRVEIPAGSVEEHEQLFITTGSRIPADGVVVSGTAEVDESAITGESMPVTKTTGDEIFAGTVVQTGYIEARATRVGGDTTFSHIISLVEQAQETRTPTMRFLQRFAAIYTPTVIALALVVGVVSGDISLGLTFLVIACPGALVISVPVAIVAGVGNLARRGVLVTSGEGLENLARANTLMVDKTGTLTTGQPYVVDFSGEEALRLAASVEVASEHHLAQAIVRAAQEQGLVVAPVADVDVTPGVGVSGVVAGRRIHVGKPAGDPHGLEQFSDWLSQWETRGLTGVYVTSNDQIIGVIGVADEVREEAADVIYQARMAGLDRIAMVTGDNLAAGTLIAGEVGIEEVHAGLLPQDKTHLVTQAQQEGEHVVMVGDGVNDAPALAQADVGVAMGGTGTDASQSSADVILMNDRLDQLVAAKRVARKTAAVMRQNTVIALGTVVVLLSGVALGHVGLAGGMLVHEASVIAVVLNALRLVRQQRRMGPDGAGSATTTSVEREWVGSDGLEPGDDVAEDDQQSNSIVVS